MRKLLIAVLLFILASTGCGQSLKQILILPNNYTRLNAIYPEGQVVILEDSIPRRQYQFAHPNTLITDSMTTMYRKGWATPVGYFIIASENDPLSFHKIDSNLQKNPITLKYFNDHNLSWPGFGLTHSTAVWGDTGVIHNTRLKKLEHDSTHWNTAYSWGDWHHTTLAGYGITDAITGSGTVTYYPKFTASQTIGNGTLYNYSNTNYSTEPLQVTGDIIATSSTGGIVSTVRTLTSTFGASQTIQTGDNATSSLSANTMYYLAETKPIRWYAGFNWNYKYSIQSMLGTTTPKTPFAIDTTGRIYTPGLLYTTSKDTLLAYNPLTGEIVLVPKGTVYGGTVTLLHTTSPITGGDITTTGTIAVHPDTLYSWRLKMNKGSTSYGWGQWHDNQTLSYTNRKLTISGTGNTISLPRFSVTDTASGLVKGSNNLGGSYYLNGAGSWSIPINTTYTAGWGLSLASTTFSADTSKLVTFGDTATSGGKIETKYASRYRLVAGDTIGEMLRWNGTAWVKTFSAYWNYNQTARTLYIAPDFKFQWNNGLSYLTDDGEALYTNYGFECFGIHSPASSSTPVVLSLLDNYSSPDSLLGVVGGRLYRTKNESHYLGDTVNIAYLNQQNTFTKNQIFNGKAIIKTISTDLSPSYVLTVSNDTVKKTVYNTSTMIYRYSAYSGGAANTAIEVLATDIGVTATIAGTLVTFSIPSEARLISAKIRIPNQSFITVKMGQTDMGNSSWNDCWTPVVQAWREDNGQQLMGISTKSSGVIGAYDELLISGLIGTTICQIRLSF